MNWNKFLPCILFGSLLGACSGKGEQPKVEPTTLCLTDSLLRIVSVDTVHVCEVVDELTLNGRVTFNQDQVANVYPMFGGNRDGTACRNRRLCSQRRSAGSDP